MESSDLAYEGVVAPSRPCRRIQTHAAIVVLSDDRAWKFKRPVRFRYLDFSSVDLRHDALDAELRLNRRTAPQMYRSLRPVCRADDGSLALDGPGETVDWVLEMTRFPDGALAVDHAESGVLPPALLDRLAADIAQLHRIAETSADHAGAARIQEVIDGNLESMLAFDDVLDPDRARELTIRLTTMVGAHRGLLDSRAAAGRVRHGHGDLHLGNIAIIDDVAVPFDCLEFDVDMATTDVLYDLAFLAMDLWSRGLNHEANLVCNSYFDVSAVDESGIGLMPLFMSVRATVRAHVAAAEHDAVRANRYLALALELTESHSPTLTAIGGGSGTGKSTRARMIGGEQRPAPGARILRSDMLRKRMAGVPMTEPMPRSHYTQANSDIVYAEINVLAQGALSSGMSVIADAVFGRRRERETLAAVAATIPCKFDGVWLELPEAERIARIAGRGPDASDADADVARAQTASIERATEWRIVDLSDG